MLAWILIATIASGALSVLVAGIFLLAPQGVRARALPHLVSFATGALLAAALIALLPEAVRLGGPESVSGIGLALVIGIGLFFILEKAVLWRHSHSGEYADHGAHHDHHHHREEASATLVLIGDSMHNALDGVLVAAAFLTDTQLGIVTAIAAVTHEIPQEIGDFAVLLASGMSRGKALFWNLATSLTSVLGGLIAYVALHRVQYMLPYALAVAAASFLYVAVADLIPGLHRKVDVRTSIMQVLLIAAGIAAIALLETSTH